MNLLIERRSSEEGVMPYLLGPLTWDRYRRVAPPVLLFGDPWLFNATLAGSSFAQKYLSAELSWEEEEDARASAAAPA